MVIRLTYLTISYSHLIQLVLFLFNKLRQEMLVSCGWHEKTRQDRQCEMSFVSYIVLKIQPKFRGKFGKVAHNSKTVCHVSESIKEHIHIYNFFREGGQEKVSLGPSKPADIVSPVLTIRLVSPAWNLIRQRVVNVRNGIQMDRFANLSAAASNR